MALVVAIRVYLSTLKRFLFSRAIVTKFQVKMSYPASNILEVSMTNWYNSKDTNETFLVGISH